MDELANWPTVIQHASHLFAEKKFRTSRNLLLENTTLVDVVPPEEAMTLQLAALYQNFTGSFKTDGMDHILSNFRLAAFVLGWYFQVRIRDNLETRNTVFLQGKFRLPDKNAEILIHLAG
jgi:hypothetical protein